MIFTRHYEFEDHALLSPSKHYWVNYDEEKLTKVYSNWYAAQRGTRLHAFAKEAIELKQKLPKSRTTLNMFVNDAIGFRMTPEQGLYYSDNCFGTADAISFNKNLLRIHDLKNGVTPASFVQLEIYAGIFCLEYNVDPNTIDIELRIYQNNDILVYIPENISEIMTKIIAADHYISALKQNLT